MKLRIAMNLIFDLIKNSMYIYNQFSYKLFFKLTLSFSIFNLWLCLKQAHYIELIFVL